VLAILGEKSRLKRLHDSDPAVVGAAHRLHDTLGFFDIGIGDRDEAAEDLFLGVPQAAAGSVVVVDHAPSSIGRDDDVGGPRDQPFELLFGERHCAKSVSRPPPTGNSRHQSGSSMESAAKQSRAIWLLDPLLGEPALSVDRRHATGSRSRHGLSVDRIHCIATREDTLDVGLAPARNHRDVSG